MRIIRIAAIALAAAFSMAATQPKADWTATVMAGPNGSHVLGNPNAEVKLTEFVSYTCPHCAAFHKESDAALKAGFVLPGRVSVEIRHIVRDPVDMTAALLANCGDSKYFFRNHNMFLYSQDKWLRIIDLASSGQKARWSSGNLGTRMKAIANDFGFYQMMEQRGYERRTIDACLADQAMADRLAKQTQDAVDAGVEGTPSFMLDGNLLTGTHDWRSLGAQIQARL